MYYSDLEPAIVAHVKLKDKLTPGEGEDVTRKVKASIERIAQIEKVSLIVICHYDIKLGEIL